MENKLEQLLNSLIEKGWKPFGMKSTFDYVDILCNQPYRFKHLNSGFGASLRELVSKGSGLWQFVCENDLINHDNLDHMDYWDKNYTRPDNKSDFCTDTYKYQYRLIEASLKDESELEDFLLSNIVIKDE